MPAAHVQALRIPHEAGCLVQSQAPEAWKAGDHGLGGHCNSCAEAKGSGEVNLSLAGSSMIAASSHKKQKQNDIDATVSQESMPVIVRTRTMTSVPSSKPT